MLSYGFCQSTSTFYMPASHMSQSCTCSTKTEPGLSLKDSKWNYQYSFKKLYCATPLWTITVSFLNCKSQSKVGSVLDFEEKKISCGSHLHFLNIEGKLSIHKERYSFCSASGKWNHTSSLTCTFSIRTLCWLHNKDTQMQISVSACRTELALILNLALLYEVAPLKLLSNHPFITARFTIAKSSTNRQMAIEME